MSPGVPLEYEPEKWVVAGRDPHTLDPTQQQDGPHEIHELGREKQRAERRAGCDPLRGEGEPVVADEHSVA